MTTIPRIEAGETLGPFTIEIPHATIAYLRYLDGLSWWERLLERPLRGWILRRNLELAREAFQR
jgi:hypothetical protein